jgi:hypothetical protein
VNVQQAPVDRSSDPERTGAIPQETVRFELRRKRIRLGLPVPKPSHAAVLRDQEIAVVTFDERVDALRGIWHRVSPGCPRLPPPETGRRSRPDCASAVLVQRAHCGAETSIISVALGTADLDRAESSNGRRPRADPYRSFPILEERFNRPPIELLVVRQLAVLPTGEPINGADPQTPVAPGSQGSNIVAREMLTRWRLPRAVANAVEAKQAEFRAEPEIAVGRLRN